MNRYAELTSAVMVAEKHLRDVYEPVVSVWIDRTKRGLGFGKPDGQWHILLGRPEEYCLLSVASVEDQCGFATEVSKLVGAIAASKEDFRRRVATAIAELTLFSSMSKLVKARSEEGL